MRSPENTVARIEQKEFKWVPTFRDLEKEEESAEKTEKVGRETREAE